MMHRTSLVAGLASALAAAGPRSQAADPDIARIDRVFSEVAATWRESLWQSLRWHRSLRTAFAEARKGNKPVYYVGADGDWFSGNC